MTEPLKLQTLPSFDELVVMLEEHPEAFEQFKKEKCVEMISSASESMQPRLWAQQSHIDRVVGRCKNPNHANVVLMGELVSQMCKFKDALDTDSIDLQPTQDNVIDFNEWR